MQAMAIRTDIYKSALRDYDAVKSTSEAVKNDMKKRLYAENPELGLIDKKINIYKKIVTTDNININIKALEKMQNYKLIVNVIVDGKQIFKKFEEFTYKDYDEYIIDNNIRIGKQKNSNFLERVSLINKKISLIFCEFRLSVRWWAVFFEKERSVK